MGKWLRGRDAILACADCIQNGKLSPKSRDFLVYFMFQLSARRALGFAAFFAPYQTELANLKCAQAELFGQCHTLAVRENWSSVTETLQHLADLEEQFRSTLLTC